MKRFLAFAGFFLALPFLVSRGSRIVRSIWIDAPRSAVFPEVSKLHAWTQWARLGGTKMTIEPPLPLALAERSANGSLRASGLEPVLRWGKTGREGSLRLVGRVENRHVGFRLRMSPGGPRLEGVISFFELGNGTRMLWACWWMGSANPLARYHDLWLRWRLHRRFQAGMEALKKYVEAERLSAVLAERAQERAMMER